MFGKLRSLIFKLDPELAHNLAIKALKYNYAPSNKIPKNNCIETEIFGKKISNPVGLAAGFDKDAEVYNSLFKLGYGFVEIGTVTPLKQYGNPKPRIFRLEDEKALINALKSKQIFGAGLDVTEIEPIKMDNPLINLENVILTPHFATRAYESEINIAKFAVTNAAKVARGDKPESIVPPV